MMEKVAVFDALSSIGFHLCARLLNEGMEVMAVDVLEGSEEKEERMDVFGRNALFSLYQKKPEDPALEDVLYECDTGFQFFRDSAWQRNIGPLAQVPFWVVIFDEPIENAGDSQTQTALASEKICYRMFSDAGVSAAILQLDCIDGHSRETSDASFLIANAPETIYTAAVRRIPGVFQTEAGGESLKKDVEVT